MPLQIVLDKLEGTNSPERLEVASARKTSLANMQSGEQIKTLQAANVLRRLLDPHQLELQVVTQLYPYSENAHRQTLHKPSSAGAADNEQVSWTIKRLSKDYQRKDSIQWRALLGRKLSRLQSAWLSSL